MNSPRLLIRNRTAPISRDGWIHIVPKGELPNPEAGIIQVLDDRSMDSILRNIEAEKARLGNRWAGLYGGEEHHIYNEDKSSAAFAWFKRFEKRADGIWASDDGLTDLGEAAIANRRFKYTSFVADPRDTEKLGGNRVRILKVETIGFTNLPNGRELLAPITNRADAGATPCDPEAVRQGFSVIVNRIRRERNCTFEAAWNAARQQEPEVFAAMAGAGAAPARALNRADSGVAPATVTDSEVKSANNRFLGLVRNRQGESQVPFERAWEEVSMEFPDVFARSYRRVLNRSGYFIKPEDQRKADKLAPDVLSDLRRDKKAPDRGETTRPVYLKYAFRSALEWLQKDGMSIEAAFAHLRENEPVFWVRGVLSYNLKADAPVQFKDFAADRVGLGQGDDVEA